MPSIGKNADEEAMILIGRRQDVDTQVIIKRYISKCMLIMVDSEMEELV